MGMTRLLVKAPSVPEATTTAVVAAISFLFVLGVNERMQPVVMAPKNLKPQPLWVRMLSDVVLTWRAKE